MITWILSLVMTDDGVWPRKISYSHSLSQKLPVPIYPLLSFFFFFGGGGLGCVFCYWNNYFPPKGSTFYPQSSVYNWISLTYSLAGGSGEATRLAWSFVRILLGCLPDRGGVFYFHIISYLLVVLVVSEVDDNCRYSMSSHTQTCGSYFCIWDWCHTFLDRGTEYRYSVPWPRKAVWMQW